MTNPTYTDDQIETAIMGATFPNRLAEMLAYVYADRQRLQRSLAELIEAANTVCVADQTGDLDPAMFERLHNVIEEVRDHE